MLEYASASLLRETGWHSRQHEVWEKGLDLWCVKDGELLVGECLNWKGGYIHPLRFQGIVSNLLSVPAKYRVLIMSFNLLTAKQAEELHSLDVKIIILDQQLSYLDELILDSIRRIFQRVLGEGVITVAVEASSLDYSRVLIAEDKSINHTNALQEYQYYDEERVKIRREMMDRWRTLSTEW